MSPFVSAYLNTYFIFFTQTFFLNRLFLILFLFCSFRFLCELYPSAYSTFYKRFLHYYYKYILISALTVHMLTAFTLLIFLFSFVNFFHNFVYGDIFTINNVMIYLDYRISFEYLKPEIFGMTTAVLDLCLTFGPYDYIEYTPSSLMRFFFKPHTSLDDFTNAHIAMDWYVGLGCEILFREVVCTVP